MFYLLCRYAIERYLKFFCYFPRKYSWVPVVTSHSIRSACLSKAIILCSCNAEKERIRRPCRQDLLLCYRAAIERVRLLQRSVWRAGNSQAGWSLRPRSPVSVSSAVTCCCGPRRFSKLSSALQPEPRMALLLQSCMERMLAFGQHSFFLLQY